MRATWIPLLAAVLLATPASAEFLLEDGDVVVMLGDSNTADGRYIQVLEAYTALRYPERDISFVNAGIGGDTAAGGVTRLETTVFPHDPTVLIVMYGINDVGWGFYCGAQGVSSNVKDLHLDSMEGIVVAAQAAGIPKIVLSSYPVVSPGTDDCLAELGEGLQAISQAYGVQFSDVFQETLAIDEKIRAHNAAAEDPELMVDPHAGVHYRDLGHKMIAYAMIKGLGGEPLVAHATLSAASASVIQQANTSITNVSGDADQLSFRRTDAGQPLTFDLAQLFSTEPWVPFAADLRNFGLRIRDLPPGLYALDIDGKRLGAYTHREWLNGAQIALTKRELDGPGGPWDAQSQMVRELIQARIAIEKARNNLAVLTSHPNLDAALNLLETTALDAGSARRLAAQPTSHDFVITRLAPTPPIAAVSRDYDGDGKTDLAVYELNGSRLYWRESGSLITRNTTVGGLGFVGVDVDFDGDRKTDPAAYNAMTGQWEYVRSSNGARVVAGRVGGRGWLPVQGDYTGDGVGNPAAYHPGSGQWYAAGPGPGALDLAGFGGPGFEPLVADIDGDGIADPGVQYAPTGMILQLGSLGGLRRSQSVASSPVEAGDFDGDGVDEVGIFLSNWLWLWVRSSDGGWGLAATNPGSEHTLVSGDYNGDGLWDAAVIDDPTARWFFAPSTSGSSGPQELLAPFGQDGWAHPIPRLSAAVDVSPTGSLPLALDYVVSESERATLEAAGWTCTSANEAAEPAQYTYADNYICSNYDLGLRFATAGPGPVQNDYCLQIDEPTDPHTWHDNFLCMPQDHGLRWSHAGAIAGMSCTSWREPADPLATWGDNYLCW